MRRVRLVTEEMLQWFAFNAAAPVIDAAIGRGSFPSAKRRIKTLMKKSLEKPSEQTIDLFIEMHRRWNYIFDVFEYLEANWAKWATWEDRMEIIWRSLVADDHRILS